MRRQRVPGRPGLNTKQAASVMRHLRALHTECDKNGAETARRLGITGAAISQLLNGHNRPSVATAVAVAKVRRVSLSEVLGEAAT